MAGDVARSAKLLLLGRAGAPLPVIRQLAVPVLKPGRHQAANAAAAATSAARARVQPVLGRRAPNPTVVPARAATTSALPAAKRAKPEPAPALTAAGESDAGAAAAPAAKPKPKAADLDVEVRVSSHHTAPGSVLSTPPLFCWCMHATDPREICCRMPFAQKGVKRLVAAKVSEATTRDLTIPQLKCWLKAHKLPLGEGPCGLAGLPSVPLTPP